MNANNEDDVDIESLKKLLKNLVLNPLVTGFAFGIGWLATFYILKKKFIDPWYANTVIFRHYLLWELLKILYISSYSSYYKLIMKRYQQLHSLFLKYTP